MIIVSGLPRSGTSLMCQLLESAGLKIADDGKRELDEHNPHGYYEVEKPLEWLNNNGVDVVKVVAHYLPQVFGDYQVIYVKRNLNDVCDSALRMSPMTEKKDLLPLLESLNSQAEQLVRARFKHHVFINFEDLVLRQDVEVLENFIGRKVDTKVIHTRN